jgi:hypothetical protein
MPHRDRFGFCSRGTQSASGRAPDSEVTASLISTLDCMNMVASHYATAANAGWFWRDAERTVMQP